jgi:hypothetical protein
MRETFFARGWCRFPYDATLARWVAQVRPAARGAVAVPDNAASLRCGGTWFVGVNVLPNDSRGAVADGMPIAGAAIDFIRRDLAMTGFGWDRGQVSVVYPGYPRREDEESPAAFRFRRERAAAHVDGILHEGPDRRRHLRMYHEFILGIPMVEGTSGMSPLVVWEGSHEIVREAFRDFFRDTSPALWPERDVTALYQSVRRTIFETCERTEIVAQPGEAYLLHRLALHGIAPWRDSLDPGPDARMIVYFRPDRGTPESWLNAP